jgi:hypothetical protein
MTLTIELNPDEEARLASAAASAGLEPAALARKLLAERLPGLPAGAADSNGSAGMSPQEKVRALLAKWQAQDNTPIVAGPVALLPGETTTQALFRKWDEEDARMTDEEREAAERLWEEFQQGVNETRDALGMRRVF